VSQYPKDQRITVNGLDFHYRDWGGSGQSLVLLHGLASTCHIWDLVAPILADDYAVVALDQRGHGESAKPDEGYHFASVARDLLGFIQGMGLEGAIIVGHSWGGDVALEFAVAYPSVARGLCFVDGGMIEPSARYSSLAETREQMAPPVLSGMTVAQFLERIRNGNQARMLTPWVEEAILANFAVLDDNTIRPQLSRENHMRIIEALWEHHPPQLYPRVECPVLLLPARQRDNPAVMGRLERREASVAAAAGSMPRSKVVWLEDSVHDVPLQRPELVASVVREHIQEGFFG
jgi:pimeloyl-ACP methyl ester carboxylesterase